MADKSFGAKQLNLVGSSGTPNVTSPNNLNLNAVTVAISTDVSIGGRVSSNVIVGTGYSVGIGTTMPRSALDVAGVVTAVSYNGSGINLTGIVTYITAGSGISVNQNTGNVTITNSSSYTSTAGVATYATTAGVSTVSQGLTGTPNITVGVVTATSYNGSGINLTGIVTYITAGSGISVNQNTGNVTITNAGAALTSNNVFTGINTFSGSNFFSGSIAIEQASESFNKYSTSIGSGTTVTLDCTTGNIHYITSTVSGNWTANLTNVGVSSGYCANYTLVIIQGTTAYIPSSLQIAGVSTSINWQGGSQPSGNNSKKDVVAYTVFNDAGAYTVFAQLVTFG